jgi:hypothetical protein
MQVWCSLSCTIVLLLLPVCPWALLGSLKALRQCSKSYIDGNITFTNAMCSQGVPQGVFSSNGPAAPTMGRKQLSQFSVTLQSHTFNDNTGTAMYHSSLDRP